MNLGFLFNNYAYIEILLYTPHFLFLGSHFENCGDVKKENVKKRGKTQLFRKLLKTNTNFEKNIKTVHIISKKYKEHLFILKIFWKILKKKFFFHHFLKIF